MANAEVDIKGLIRAPKPAFAAEGTSYRDGEPVAFRVIFDGHGTSLIDRPSRTELRNDDHTILVEESGVEAFDGSPGAINNDVKVHVGLGNMTYLKAASIQVLGETSVAGRRCHEVRAVGLHQYDRSSFELCVDAKTGVVLRTVSGGDVAFEIERFRVAGTGDPAEHVGRGTVYVSWDEGSYAGHWELGPGGPGRVLEQMPAATSALRALTWARARTDRVFIRPRSDPGRTYWAGIGEPPPPASATDPATPVFGGDDGAPS